MASKGLKDAIPAMLLQVSTTKDIKSTHLSTSKHQEINNDIDVQASESGETVVCRSGSLAKRLSVEAQPGEAVVWGSETERICGSGPVEVVFC